MANWTATGMGAVALLICGTGIARGQTPVVLHVTSYDRIPQHELAAAEGEVVDLYGKIGVRTAWTGGAAAQAEPDDGLHLDVIFVTDAMAARKQSNTAAFGQASHTTRKAYIYYGRIRSYSRQTGSNPACVLALVLAHELGHMLLPEYSHAPSGLMVGEWSGRIVRVPDFLPQQALAIRAMLSQRR